MLIMKRNKIHQIILCITTSVLLLCGCVHRNDNKLLDSIKVSSYYWRFDKELDQCKRQVIKYVNVFELCINEYLMRRAGEFETLILESTYNNPGLNRIKYYLESNEFICKEKQVDKITSADEISMECEFLHRSTAPGLIGRNFDGYYEWFVYVEAEHVDQLKNVDVNINYRKELSD